MPPADPQVAAPGAPALGAPAAPSPPWSASAARRPPEATRARPASTDGPRARGARDNPPNRFDRLRYAADDGAADASGPAAPGPGAETEGSRPRTLFFRDPSRTIVASNESPDVGFDVSVNPYRGCEHGCIYCYARPTHEYLGFSAGLDFETRILVKEHAPQLLREALASKRWRPQVLGLAGVTDVYQPIERRLGLTRRCLEVLLEYRNPVAVVTKSGLVARDADLLAALAEFRAAHVHLSITTLDPELQRAMEPRAAPPHQRLEAIEALARAGVPVGVNVAPVIPGLNDHEIPSILEAAAAAGARCGTYLMLRLPHGVEPLFVDWLETRLPLRAPRVLGRIRDVRGGRLSDPRFGHRHRGAGPFAEQIRQLFQVTARRLGLSLRPQALSADAFRRPGTPQLELFASAPDRRSARPG